MSLVAYGSSDESDASDTEESPAPINQISVRENNNEPVTDQSLAVSGTTNEGSGEISDSDGEDVVTTRQPTGGSQPVDDEDLFKRLPSPKDQDMGVMDETDELEEEVKPKPSQVADAPTPPLKKSRQPVKITIPALPDSDDDEGPVEKKMKVAPAKGKSGLFSMLPSPVHAAKKEANRILIPYSLSKKPKANASGSSSDTTSASAKPKPSNEATVSKPLSGLIGYDDSDSDENDNASDSGNFFSLDSTVLKTKSSTSSSVPSASSSSAVDLQSAGGVPTVPLPTSSNRTALSLPAPVKTDTVDISQVSESSDVADDLGEGLTVGQPMNQDAPLTFKGGVTSKAHYGVNPYLTGTPSISDSPSQNMYYNMQYDGEMQYPEVSDDQALQYDQEFLRLQGKKQRGREEINIVDVNADDFTSPEDLGKYVTEEQTHQSHSKKDGNQPTAQQKRKHQIQYLAFQAKEMELELKNSWSQSRMTKKQTQAKYGF